MLKIKRVLELKELKIEDIEKEKYYILNFETNKIRDLYYVTIMEIKATQENIGIIIEVEEE